MYIGAHDEAKEHFLMSINIIKATATTFGEEGERACLPSLGMLYGENYRRGAYQFVYLHGVRNGKLA